MMSRLGVRKKNLVYVVVWILYYAWVIVFSTWWTAMPDTSSPFNAEMRLIIHGVNLLSSAVFVLIVRFEWFVAMARIGAVFIVVALLTYIVVKEPDVRFATAVLLAIAIGCVNISILMPFVFTMNDSERLLSVTGSNVLIYLLLFLQGVLLLGSNMATALSLVILGISLATIPFFRKGDVSGDCRQVEKGSARIGRGGYLILALSCAFAFLGRGVSKGLVDTLETSGVSSSQIIFITASAAGAVFFFILYRFAKATPQVSWNITFGFLAVAFILYAFSQSAPLLLVPFTLFAGLGNTMGMCSMYYLLGTIGNRFQSMRYVRLSIILIGVCGGISGIIMGSVIAGQKYPELTLAMAIISTIAVLAFLAASPSLPRYGDSQLVPDTTTRDGTLNTPIPFTEYGLSKRESEVCELLLQGYTMRQIAGLLSISYPTVNTYCTSLYRKTGVNSRTELILLFKDHLR